MLQFGNDASSNGIKTAARLLETIMIELFSCGSADDVALKCFDRWSQSNNIMKVVAKGTSKPLFIWPVSRFNKTTWTQPSWNVDWRSFMLDPGKWISKECRYLQADWHRTQRKSQWIRASVKALWSKEVRKRNPHRDGPDHRNDRNRVSLVDQRQDIVGAEVESRIEALGREARYCQNYPVRQVICPAIELERPKTHRRR